MKAAVSYLMEEGVLKADPVIAQIAAVSAGVVNGDCVLDLEYEEDRVAETDANFVLTSTGGVIEVQATAEDAPMTQEQFDQIFALARKGVSDLCAAQLKALGQ